MNNSDKPAYPTLVQASEPECWDTINGLTKREYFAAMAMQGILANESLCIALNREVDKIANAAVYQADELLKQLEQ